ncbi:14759_t:CDS:2 [Cetraspora pellucida]|uniref:14759_t:CDS:1 n=1 Tax=Cetraspora pellucida TaxID=1433469 RepID=A0A9N8YXR2_9GLOM|nr:14759_t:CDS:2 [Cetraspora pellucida]
MSTQNVYSDNISECESENYSDYGSDYEPDIETSTIKSLSSQPPKVEEQKFNKTYILWQEKFNDKFTKKDLLNKICEIASLSARYMSNIKDSLEDVYLWDYLLPNYGAKEGIIVDDISEVYGLSEIHECINGQRPLRAVINIDALQENIESEKVNAKNVFIRICCLYIRALYMILNCSWEEIFEGLVIATSSDFNNGWDELDHARVQPPDSAGFEYGCVYGYGSFIVKCFQQSRDEQGVIFNNLSIAEKIQQKNKNNIPPPVIRKIKGSKFPWPFLEMPAWVNCDFPLIATEVYKEQYVEPLPNKGDVYVGSPWGMEKTHTLEHLTILESINLLALSI